MLNSPVSSGPNSRRIDITVFTPPWDARKAYLLGQFRAGANFSINKKSNTRPKGEIFNVVFCTTNLPHLIKMQILLGSDHKIFFDTSQMKRHPGSSLRFMYDFKNKYIFSDLRHLGFVSSTALNAKDNAPFPDFLEDSLIRHYIRGYFDERCSPYSQGRRIDISGSNPNFLKSIANYLDNKLLIESIPIKQKQGSGKKLMRSYNLSYSREENLGKLFKFLYHDIPSSLYCVERYSRWCKMLKIGEDYEGIDVSLDVQTMYLVHAFCTVNRLNIDDIIKAQFGHFLEYCKTRELIPRDKQNFIEQAEQIMIAFRYDVNAPDWRPIFEEIFGRITND